MATTAEIQANIATLELALASATAALAHGDTSITKRKVDEIISAIAYFKDLLPSDAANQATVRMVRLDTRDRS